MTCFTHSSGSPGVEIARFYSSDTWIDARAEDQLASVAGWAGMRAIAAFPDLHPGRHGPVGAAFLADRIYPQLVGPDIGCGMSLFALDLPVRKLRLNKAVQRLGVLDTALEATEAQNALDGAGLGDLPADGLGTIGGGNHFCEIQVVSKSPDGSALPSEGSLCLLVHSGSRGLGAGIFSRLEAHWGKGYAPQDSEGKAYLQLHDQAVRWASLNRYLIATRAAQALRSDLSLLCDSPHNLLTWHDDAWLHRKGAAAPDHCLAPLAGSRDAPSFLLEVRPPDDALSSLSHGAGRRYDRSAMHGRIARTRSGRATESRNRFGGHVVCTDRDLLVEEAGKAYKPVEKVHADLRMHGFIAGSARLEPRLTWKTGIRK